MCELCRLSQGNIKTKLYYQDQDIIIVDCITCRVSIVVWKEHTVVLESKDLKRIFELVSNFFPECKCRMQMRKIPDHFHFHINK